jgi:hypothetical protein
MLLQVVIDQRLQPGAGIGAFAKEQSAAQFVDCRFD